MHYGEPCCNANSNHSGALKGYVEIRIRLLDPLLMPVQAIRGRDARRVAIPAKSGFLRARDTDSNPSKPEVAGRTAQGKRKAGI